MIRIIPLILLSVYFSHSIPLTRDDRIVFQDTDNDGEISYGMSRLSVYEASQDDGNDIQDDPEASIGAEFSSDFFQGDIALTEEQQIFFNATEDDEDEPFRTGLIDKRHRWPKNDEGHVIVPYVIDTTSEYCEFLLEKKILRVIQLN
jgi:hypothetical protein